VDPPAREVCSAMEGASSSGLEWCDQVTVTPVGGLHRTIRPVSLEPERPFNGPGRPPRPPSVRQPSRVSADESSDQRAGKISDGRPGTSSRSSKTGFSLRIAAALECGGLLNPQESEPESF
jgi:hypothetical protein